MHSVALKYVFPLDNTYCQDSELIAKTQSLLPRPRVYCQDSELDFTDHVVGFKVKVYRTDLAPVVSKPSEVV
jgi:hypothetical protein